MVNLNKTVKMLSCGIVILGLWACKQPTSQGQSTTNVAPANATIVNPINVVTPQADSNLTDAIHAYLKEKHQINSDDFKLKSIENVSWADACLGVSKPGQICAQVITPGFKVIFENPQRQLIIHTDATGRRIILANP